MPKYVYWNFSLGFKDCRSWGIFFMFYLWETEAGKILWPLFFVLSEHLIGLRNTQYLCMSTISGIGEQKMSSSGSKHPLLLYGILLCSSFAPLPVISSKRQTIQSAGPLSPVSGSSWDKRELTARDGEYLLGIKRLRRLYCNVGIGFHIQVLPNGKITGVHNENRYSKSFCLSLFKSM